MEIFAMKSFNVRSITLLKNTFRKSLSIVIKVGVGFIIAGQLKNDSTQPGLIKKPPTKITDNKNLETLFTNRFK